jgi:hypothetical protein
MRPMKFWVLVVGLVVGIVFSPSGANAGGIAVESVAGDRPKATAAALSEIFDELKQRGYRSGAEVGKAFEKSGSRPSRVGSGLPLDFATRVDQGYRLWITGKFQEGIAALKPLVDEAHRNPASVITVKEFGPALFKAQVGIAMCQHRLGDDNAAWATLAELVRSFDLEVTKGQYGAEAAALYQQVRKEAKATATGGLTVRAADSTAVIYINERFARVGEVSRVDLIPGVYRVVAQLGQDKLGRAYDIEVKAGAKVDLVVDPAFESAVVTGQDWTGLWFRDRSEREVHENAVAARLGSSLGELGVMVVGVDTRNERTVAYGALVNASTGKEIRRASVVIDTPPPPGRLRALVRFLAGEPTPLDGVEVHKAVVRKPAAGGGSVVVSEAPPPPIFTRRRKISVAVAAGAAGAIAAGVVMTLQAKDFDDRALELCPDGPKVPCSRSDDATEQTERGEKRSYLAIGAYGVGALMAAGATYLWLSGAPTESETALSTDPRLAPRVAPGFAGLELLGRF